MALPSDQLGEIFDQYQDFAVGLCQCRMGAEIIGQYCGRPMENCVTMGPLALRESAAGHMRKITLKDALEIKAEAEASGLVSWTMGYEIAGSNTSCSCCGCCCMMMRSPSANSTHRGGLRRPISCRKWMPPNVPIAENAPGPALWGPGPWIPKPRPGPLRPIRCVGCGLCYVACDKDKAIALKPVSGYVTPTVKKLERASHPLESISGVKE